MRHKLALLVMLCGALTMAACGDDNDTPIPTPTAVNTPVPPPPTTPPTQAPPTNTHTPSNGTPVPTSTPTATFTGGTPGTLDFSCDFRTSWTCVGGSRNEQACRPTRQDPEPEDLCPGGTCTETQFFCKGGDRDGTACDRPRNARTPEPCTGGGRCQNSELQICTQAVCPIVARRLGGGRIDVTCDNDDNECRGTLVEFDPVDIPGIGFVCVRPVPELDCPPGHLECSGGNGLDYDLLQVHTIGACGVPNDPNDSSGNGQCESMCRDYCEGMGAEMIDFGCTGYCRSGGEGNSKKDRYCECDGESAACMLGGGTFRPNCAPNGSCNGKDQAIARDRNVCGCQCLTEGGNPSRAGGINFRVGAQIIVETAPPCGEPGNPMGAVLLTLAPQCIPLTSEISTGVLTRANNPTNPELCPNGLPAPGCAQIPMTGKLERVGVPTSCDALREGSATGLNIVGNISFFDSTIGDIETVLDWNCQ